MGHLVASAAIVDTFNVSAVLREGWNIAYRAVRDEEATVQTQNGARSTWMKCGTIGKRLWISAHLETNELRTLIAKAINTEPAKVSRGRERSNG